MMMPGHLRPRGRQKWGIILELPRDPDGKRRTRQVATVEGTRRQAQAELDRLKAELARPGYVEPSRLTFAALCDRFLTHADGLVRPNSLAHYRRTIDNHLRPRLGEIPLVSLSAWHLDEYYAAVRKSGGPRTPDGLAPSTIRSHHQILSRILRLAKRWRLIDRNPLEDLDPPPLGRRPQKSLDLPGLAALLRALEGERVYLPVLLAVGSGLRVGELAGLMWQDVDLETGAFVVRRQLQRVKQDGKATLAFGPPKSQDEDRPSHLPASVLPPLRAHLGWQETQARELGSLWQGQGMILCLPDGRPWGPDAISMALRTWYRRHPELVRVRFHDLRHTSVSLLASRGVPIHVISARVGHRSPATTLNVYAHLLPGQQESAARAMDQVLRQALGEGEERHTS